MGNKKRITKVDFSDFGNTKKVKCIYGRKIVVDEHYFFAKICFDSIKDF